MFPYNKLPNPKSSFVFNISGSISAVRTKNVRDYNIRVKEYKLTISVFIHHSKIKCVCFKLDFSKSKYKVLNKNS